MEEILKEILYELKGIRQALDKDYGLKEILDKGSDISLTVTIGDDVVAEKVIKSINAKSRTIGSTTIVI